MRLTHHRSWIVVAALLTILAPPAAAEDGATFAADVVANLQSTAQKLIALAEATPETMFTWRPNTRVRSVSEVYMHVVGTNMLLPSALGAAPPEGLEIPENSFSLMREWEETVTEKEAVIARLKESFEYLARILPTLQDLDAEVALFGPPQPKRAYLLILLGHAHEHLGQSIAYARSFGVAPPWSRQQDGG